MKLSQQYVNIYKLQKMNLSILIPTKHYIYIHWCVYFHTTNKEMTNTEIHPDHTIMTKIKSVNIKLKENPKKTPKLTFSKRTKKKKIPNVWICLHVYKAWYLHTLQIIMKIQIKTSHLKENINWTI